MIVNLLIIGAIIIYAISVFLVIGKRKKQDTAMKAVNNKKFRLLFYEKKVAEMLKIPDETLAKFFIPFRICTVALLVGAAYFMGTIAMIFVACAIIIFFMNEKTKALIDETGVEYIGILNQFLDVFSPSLAAGSSTDQALLKYVSDVNDDNLLQWWVHKEDGLFELDNKWKGVVEVYNMMKFNETHGVGNGLKVIEEMQKVMTQKEKFYNEFLAKMGEIQPIMISYYVAVPILLLISLHQVHDFWFGPWGIVCAIIIVVLFMLAQYLIYKIKESTVKIMF